MSTYKQLADFLVDMGIEKVPHSQKSYLAHLIGVYKFMEVRGCTEEMCQAGMFHSIYGTEQFQGFKLELDRRPEVRDLIGDRAERLAYFNCAMDRATFDALLEQPEGPYVFRERTGAEIRLDKADFDDLVRIHLYDWLEQAPRSRLGWNYRRVPYRKMAERLGGIALESYDKVFATEPQSA